MDCYEVCVKYISSTESNLTWDKVQSLPVGAIHVLKGTYGHCKVSSELYGELLVHVSEPLSALFRKAHSLQVAFLNLLERLTIEGTASDKDVNAICLVCCGLFEVCQIVASLDVKLVVTLWKAISKHAVRKKELLRHHLNVDDMVKHLCSEISTGYTYLFQLLPHVDGDGIVLSQGDEKGFQKSVKILGFQMKIMVSLVREYSSYLSDCGQSVYKLLIHLKRLMPPSIHRQPVANHHVDEIKRQLLNATEPLVNSLLTNTVFIHSMTSHASVNQITAEDSLPHLLLLLIVMDEVPKLEADEKDKWLSPNNYTEDSPQHSLFDGLFHVLMKCSVEMNLPVYVEGFTNTNRKERDICLYDEVCVHFCGLIGCLPAKYFSKLEEVLMKNILSTDVTCAQLTSDAWCFLVRYGTAELCYSHVRVLLEVSREITGFSLQYLNVTVLLNRMIKFLAKEHQVDILKLYHPTDNLSLWSSLAITSFTSTNARNLVDTLTSHSIKTIHNFVSTTEKKVESFVSLSSCLDVLINIYSNPEVVEKYLLPDVQSAVVDKTTTLCNSFSDWMMLPVTRLCFGKMVKLYSVLLQNLNNKEILQILMLTLTAVKQISDQHLKLSIAKFLQELGKVKLCASFEQSQILNRIPELFNILLSDTDPVVKHTALEAFTKFAEMTVHESVVPNCIQDQEDIQNSVVAFLNKTPVPSSMKRRDYLTMVLQLKDDIDQSTILEPSSKRPRMENLVSSEKRQQLIETLISCSQGLQDSDETLPSNLIYTLKQTRELISRFLDDNGL